MRFLSAKTWRYVKGVAVIALLTEAAWAQGAGSLVPVNDSALNFDRTGPVAGVAAPPSAPAAKTLPEAPSHHRFWDGQNQGLFAAVAVLSAADFAVTRANLQSGGKELNPVTRFFSRSTAGLAVNFVGETAGIIGLSYYLHRTGHHRLERIAPAVDIGASSFAVVYDLSHR